MKMMPTLTTMPTNTPAYLSDDAEGCALDLIDQLDDLGDGISNFTSVTNDRNNDLSTDPTTTFWELPDQTTSPLVQNTSWDPEYSQVFRPEPNKQAGSKRKSPFLTSDSDKVDAIFELLDSLRYISGLLQNVVPAIHVDYHQKRVAQLWLVKDTKHAIIETVTENAIRKGRDPSSIRMPNLMIQGEATKRKGSAKLLH